MLALKSFDALGECFDEVYFCLDEEWDGKVVWILNEPGYPVELLNNTVPQMAEMLLLYEEDHIGRRMLDWEKPDEYKQHFDSLRLRMRTVDPEALQDDRGWSEMIYRLEE